MAISEHIEKKTQLALQFHQQGNAKEAEKLYQEIIQENPKNANVYHLLGILQAQQSNFSLAQEYLGKAIELEPNSPSFHNSMGNIFKNLGNLNKAILHYQKAIELNPNYAVAHNSLGNIFLKQGKNNKAKKYYQEAIRLQLNYPDAHYNLAIILLKQGLVEEATKHLNTTLQLEPEHVEANNQIAQILHKQQKLDDAIVHYKKCLKYDPFNAEVFHNLGSIFLEQKKPDAALKYFLRLLQISPDFDTYYNLGLIYMVQDRLNDSVQYFKKALEIKPDDIATHQNLGVIFLRVEDYDNAIKHYKKASELEPDNKEIKYILDALSSGQTPEQAPKEYIEHLFDQYAPHFDQHLTKMLDYKAPTLLFNAVNEELTTTDKLTILDLGCGTGLAGEKFRKMADKLIGVDLSANMIEIAKSKQAYDDLFVADVNDILKKYNNIDLIVAADTVVYFGDLTELFANCAAALKNSGLFAFTCEETYQYPYELKKSARFAHNKKYIEKITIKNGLEIIRFNNAILRKQQGKNVEGYLYILRKI